MAPPMQVTAKQLYVDYHANEVAADDSQKSKAMSLSKGKQQALLCKGQGMTIGDRALGDCRLP